MKPTIYALAFLVFFSLHSISSHSQTPPTKQWDVRFGGSSIDSLMSVCTTPDGGYILGGYTRSDAGDDITEASRGGDDYWMVKIDASGNKLWDKRFGGGKNDFLTMIKVTPDHGFILGGFSFSPPSGDHSESNRGKCDYWVVKTDSNGNKQWDKRFGGSTYDYLFDVENTAGGGYILAGYTDSQIGGDVTVASRGANDYWIVKIDASGNKQWDARYGGGSDDNLSCILQTKDHGYLLGGLTHSKLEDGGDITEGVLGVKDYWVVKTDSNGVKQWDNRIGGTDRDIQHDAISTIDGGYMLTGLSTSPVSYDVMQPSRGVEDYWVVKLDSTGFAQWNKKFGSNDVDIANCLIATVDGNYITAGSSRSHAGNEKSQNTKGFEDYWIVKFDKNGNKIWDLDLGGNTYDIPFGICKGKDGGYLVGGASWSGKTGDKSQTSRGLSDYWVVKLNPEMLTWYRDVDGDGYGDNDFDSVSIEAPVGYSALDGDCNDSNAAINPLTPELCNGIDDNCNQLIDDNAVPVTVSPSGIVRICQNSSVTFTATGNNITGYQWYKNGAMIPGQTNASYTASANANINVAVTSSNGCSGNSDVVTLIVNPLPTAQIVVGNGGNLNLCNGTVVLTAPTTFESTFQWYKNGNAISGATNDTLIPTVSAKYKVTVTNVGTQCSKTTSQVQVTKPCKTSMETDLLQPLEIFPNPVTDVVTFKTSDDFGYEELVSVQIINELGQEIYNKNISVADGVITLSLDDSFTGNQIYWVKLKAGDHFYEGKFVTQK